MKNLAALFLTLFSLDALSYVACRDVSVNALQTATGPGFHGMNKGGAVGKMIFIAVPVASCTAHNGEDISKGVFLVIDDVGNQNDENYDLKKFWSSQLLAAKSTGSTIDFHAHYGGGNNWDAAVVEPYYINYH